MAVEKLYNASDPRHVKGRKDQEKRETLHSAEAFDFVMGDRRGRHFVWLLLGDTGLFRDSFTGNSHTFYNEGKRSVGLKLQSDLEKRSSKNFIAMWQEHLVSEEKTENSDQANRIESEEGEF